MYGVLLIVVLIITGGAIAFIGDRLGTKIGKKRLSLFGLRPRHTSVVITIFTGICITTLTFGVMAAASQNVRTALFGMEQLNRTMRETKDSLNQAQADLQQAQVEQQQTDEALAKSKDDVEKLKGQQQELEEKSARLQEGNRLLEAAKLDLLHRNDVLAAENSTLGAQNELLTGTNKTLTENNAVLERHAQNLRDGLITIREGDIVYQAGEVIASGVVRGGRTQFEVDNDLRALAELANRNVSEKLGEDKSDQDIWIYQPEYAEAVKTIAASRNDMVVRIVAAGNLVRGEAIRTTLELYKNSTVYEDKEFILAKPYMLTGKSDSEPEQVVMDFLNEVNRAATAKGILPDPIRGTVGVIEGAQFYDIVGSLRGKHGSWILSAYANGATDAIGPLRLKIRVEQQGNLP
ncbi:DUF3084 domain-containing protein [Selenomonas sp. ND2010]|jgi:uncharacterized protein (DUF3084 family)|uniref:DUF3084 domain-containing protein n=1 Tax=Selenomonas sp. ND2010 TaxID=1410618 RepID=UPI00051B2D99|nr:DUF3084 domain-containing protein [Selenomonas sp. ND2010]